MPMRNWAEIAEGLPMNESAALIILHQLLFQGMFFVKNISLQRKLHQPIRGFNLEANLSIAFFVFFIAVSIYLALTSNHIIDQQLVPTYVAQIGGVLLMLANLAMGLAALKHLGDSWRVGVLEEQTTELVESGIYRISRNPFFVAYLLMFAAYTVLLQSPALLLLSLLGFAMVHSMVRREETYLQSVHGATYNAYRQRVPRYLGLPSSQ